MMIINFADIKKDAKSLNEEDKNVEVKDRIESKKFINIEENRRKRNNMNDNREMNQKNFSIREEIEGISKNGLKEKCFFRLNDNITCDNYYDKEYKNVNPLRSRNISIRSQF